MVDRQYGKITHLIGVEIVIREGGHIRIVEVGTVFLHFFRGQCTLQRREIPHLGILFKGLCLCDESMDGTGLHHGHHLLLVGHRILRDIIGGKRHGRIDVYFIFRGVDTGIFQEFGSPFLRKAFTCIADAGVDEGGIETIILIGDIVID